MATPIGINWDPVWKDVWKDVWRQEVVVPPEPEPPSLAHGAGMSRGYQEAFRQQAIAIDDEEILLILSEALPTIDSWH